MTRIVALALLFAAAAAVDAQQQLRPLDENAYRQIVSSHKGQVLMVDFWATWCAPCLEEMPGLVSLAEKYRGKGLRLVTVSCDEPEEEQQAYEFLCKSRAPEPFFLKAVEDDEALITFVDPKWSGALPALFLYDRNGRLVKSFVGEKDKAAVEKAIQSLL